MSDVAVNNLLNVFAEKCKEHNLKITPQRTIIYRELIKAKDHPSSDIMFKKVRRILPNISFDTINRTLLTFSKIGIVDVVEGYGDPKRFDPDISSHHHFRCMECNEIIDVYDESFDKLEIPPKLHEQFSIRNKKVVLEGLCLDCNYGNTGEWNSWRYIVIFKKIKRLLDHLLERVSIVKMEPARCWTEEKNYDRISYEKK